MTSIPDLDDEENEHPDNDVNANDDAQSRSEEPPDFAQFQQETQNLPPGRCPRSAFKRHMPCSGSTENKRPRLSREKRKLSTPSVMEQKRQRLEAIELAAFFCA